MTLVLLANLYDQFLLCLCEKLKLAILPLLELIDTDFVIESRCMCVLGSNNRFVKFYFVGLLCTILSQAAR